MYNYQGQRIYFCYFLFRYNGRHHAQQFLPAKRGRFGLKVYKLAPSSGPMAGYTSAFKVYMGKNLDRPPVKDASFQAVFGLMNSLGLFDLGHTVYTDSWYTSPTLFHYMQSRRTNAVGTVRTNRKFMPADMPVFKKKKDNASQLECRRTPTGMLALSYMDNRQVNLLSTIHRGDEWKQLKPNHKGEPRSKPLAVYDYNQGMGGVDLSDQMASHYHTPRKCMKWYHNLFFHLVDTALVNAFLVYRCRGGPQRQLGFRKELINQLLLVPMPRPPRTPTPQDAVDLPLAPAGHHLMATPNGKYRRCRRCKQRSDRRKESRFQCMECDVGLCPGKCFYEYHQA